MPSDSLYLVDADTRMAYIARGLVKRRRAARRLRYAGISAIATALAFLCILLGSIFSNGYTALRQTEIMVKIEIPAADLVDASGAIDPKNRKPSIGRVLSKNRFARFFRMLPA